MLHMAPSIKFLATNMLHFNKLLEKVMPYYNKISTLDKTATVNS